MQKLMAVIINPISNTILTKYESGMSPYVGIQVGNIFRQYSRARAIYL
jgi:hypothetical protein